MRGRIATLYLTILITFPLTRANLNITVCNCERAEAIGLMDIQQPSYCEQNDKQNKGQLVEYEFYTVKEPHKAWNAFACMQWEKQKTIEGFFFGGYDTVYSTKERTLTEEECW